MTRLLLDPSGERTAPHRELLPRPASIAGHRIGLLDISKPRGNVFLGQSAIINLAGDTPQQMIVRSPLALLVPVLQGALMAVMNLLAIVTSFVLTGPLLARVGVARMNIAYPLMTVSAFMGLGGSLSLPTAIYGQVVHDAARDAVAGAFAAGLACTGFVPGLSTRTASAPAEWITAWPS